MTARKSWYSLPFLRVPLSTTIATISHVVHRRLWSHFCFPFCIVLVQWPMCRTVSDYFSWERFSSYHKALSFAFPSELCLPSCQPSGFHVGRAVKETLSPIPLRRCDFSQCPIDVKETHKQNTGIFLAGWKNRFYLKPLSSWSSGDTEAGQKIQTSLRSGLLDSGPAELKRWAVSERAVRTMQCYVQMCGQLMLWWVSNHFSV